MILHGDCLDKLKQLEDNSVDSVVTDPPYGLAFMGKKWDYDVPSIAIWQEALRVLKPGGHLLSFGGTRTYHRMVVNIEDAGFEIRDQIQWLYGSGFPKSHNIEKASGDEKYKGWGTALKPANEPICLARKPLEKGLTIAENVLKWGVGGLNIDATRIGTSENTGRVSGKTAIWSSDIAPVKTETHSQGRFPANLILDETAAEMLDEQSGISKAKPGRAGKRGGKGFGFFDDEKSKNETGIWPQDQGGGASRFFYVAKASKRERGEDNNHPTVKPIKLMEYLCKLITPPNGVVLDPFMGSGSTGVAAKSLGFKFIGIEREKEYVEIAEKRIGA